MQVQYEVRDGKRWACTITRLSVLPLADAAQRIQQPAKITSVAELQLAMRKLWEDDLAYTRQYLVSAIAGLADEDAAAQRWLRTQQELGQSIAPYYGDERARRLTALLRDHVLIASEAVQAAKLGRAEALTAARARWNDQADAIAALLSEVNPNWNARDVADMLQNHAELTISQAVSRVKREWVADLDFHDRDHVQILMLADALATGIGTQLPEKFTPPIDQRAGLITPRSADAR